MTMGEDDVDSLDVPSESDVSFWWQLSYRWLSQRFFLERRRSVHHEVSPPEPIVDDVGILAAVPARALWYTHTHTSTHTPSSVVFDDKGSAANQRYGTILHVGNHTQIATKTMPM